MSNENPRRGLNTAGLRANADRSEQSQHTASPASFQPISRAIAVASDDSELIVAALAYAQARLRVFPCNPRDKTPLVAHGFKAATTDPKQIRAWWERWPNAMISMPTGRTSGIFVLDVDVDPEKNIDGFAELAALEMQHGKLPETLCSVTPRGGMHYFFVCSEGIKTSAGKLGVGLDVRGDLAFIIMPPSVRSDGKAYKWQETSAPAAIAPPQWFIDRLLTPKGKPAPVPQPIIPHDAYVLAAFESECAAVATAQVGERNDTLNRASFSLGQLVASGALPENNVRDQLYSAAVACGPVKDDGANAVCATIESGASAGLKQPRTIPELRATHGAAGNGNCANHADAKQDERSPLQFCDIAAWARSKPPEREWGVLDRFPLRNVALLSGEGSIGKSILLMQLAAAHVLAKDWLGTLPEPGPGLYLNAEDEEAELHRRSFDIATHYGAALSDLKNSGLHVLSLAGQDAVLGYPDRNGLIKATPLFHKLTEAARDIRPKLIGLDTSADIFAGNENDRSQVRQFIGLLRRMAIDANAAVLVCAHPSLTGVNSGTGLSGSTAWHNSVRARAYLRTVNSDDGRQPDQTLRRLDFMKSNYGPIAESLMLRWRNGAFVREPTAGSLERLAADATAESVFLELVERFTKEGRTVGEKKGHSYAPAQFSKEAEAKAAGLRSEALADAMRRLFAAKKIHVEAYGRPSNPHHRIAVGPPQ